MSTPAELEQAVVDAANQETGANHIALLSTAAGLALYNEGLARAAERHALITPDYAGELFLHARELRLEVARMAHDQAPSATWQARAALLNSTQPTASRVAEAEIVLLAAESALVTDSLSAVAADLEEFLARPKLAEQIEVSQLLRLTELAAAATEPAYAMAAYHRLADMYALLDWRSEAIGAMRAALMVALGLGSVHILRRAAHRLRRWDATGSAELLALAYHQLGDARRARRVIAVATGGAHE